MTASAPHTSTPPRATAPRSGLLNALLGLTALDILLQGLWAGIFLEHDGKRDSASGWLNTHAAGANVAIVLAFAASIVAALRVRPRQDLVRGSAALTALLIIETVLGHVAHSGTDTLTAIHVPLAMVIMAMAAALPVRARKPAKAAADGQRG
jgi:hypothetical protein